MTRSRHTSHPAATNVGRKALRHTSTMRCLLPLHRIAQPTIFRYFEGAISAVARIALSIVNLYK